MSIFFALDPILAGKRKKNPFEVSDPTPTSGLATGLIKSGLKLKRSRI